MFLFGGEIHDRPNLPFHAVCCSARMTVPCGSPEPARVNPNKFVDGVLARICRFFPRDWVERPAWMLSAFITSDVG